MDLVNFSHTLPGFTHFLHVETWLLSCIYEDTFFGCDYFRSFNYAFSRFIRYDHGTMHICMNQVPLIDIHAMDCN